MPSLPVNGHGHRYLTYTDRTKNPDIKGKQGLSQLELASEIDLSKTHLGRIERAESNITVKSLNKLANFFEVDITYFFKTD